MKVIIDRFEGDYAILEINKNTRVQIPSMLVDGAREGDIVEIKVDKMATEERKKHIQELQNSLFED